MANAQPQVADQTQADPLAQLRDLHLPGAIENWPPAVGWWLLAFITVVLVSYLLFLLYQFWKNKQYRREGIRALEKLKQSFEASPDTINFLEQYSQLLKRVSFSCFSRNEVASLTGESWVAFLDQSGNTKEFSMGCGQVLIDGNYAQEVDYDYLALHEIGKKWIKNHRRPRQ
ncbi:MAG: hypothetical protein ACI9FB_000197 [Candidatus Azotimanducaceae bacterium]|jgi:hypothetical protein